MTNVPQKYRDLWTDFYVLFDKNYLMNNTQMAWDMYWKQVEAIRQKYPGCPYIIKMTDLVTQMIEDRIKATTDCPPIQQEMGLF